MPAARRVSRSLLSSSQVLGGSTPASSNVETLYQMVDLFAPLYMTAYCVPSTDPASATASPNASTILSRRLSIGLIAPFFAKSAIKPGWPIAARVARLPPPDVYLTLTFGYFSSKPSITAWNDVCSLPAQMAMTDTFPLTFSLPLAPSFPPPPPPQPGAANASRATSAATTDRCLIPELLPPV